MASQVKFDGAYYRIDSQKPRYLFKSYCKDSGFTCIHSDSPLGDIYDLSVEGGYLKVQGEKGTMYYKNGSYKKTI